MHSEVSEVLATRLTAEPSTLGKTMDDDKRGVGESILSKRVSLMKLNLPEER